MKIAILKVILWPKDTSHSPRIIHLQPGKINIITGESGSGKSTLSWIIDYCLGSDKCSIPVGLIREVTSWFGLHLQLANTEMIIARRNPEDQQSTSDIFWVEGLSVAVPQTVEKNARVEDVKNRFNQIAHLPNLDFSIGENVGYGGRASFRDMSAFNFQPQHIVANPYTYFFKADTTEHREKLRIIFPLVLGAIDAATLAKQRELKDAEREYDRWKRELDARLGAARAWEAEVKSYYLQAQTLGLIPIGSSPQANWNLDRYILDLKKVPENVKTMDLPDISEGTNEAAAKELTKLINEEDRLGQEIGSNRRRLAKLEQLSSSVGDYTTTLTGQEDRLQATGWFEDKLKDTHQCPVCSAVHNDGNPRLNELLSLARELKTLTATVHQAPAKLDQELATLRTELRELEVLQSKIRQQRKFVEGQSTEQSRQRQSIRQVYLFVGRVEQALENLTASRNVEDLQEKVRNFEKQIRELKKELDPQAQKNRLEAAIDTVSAKIADYAKLLRLEHSNENIRLNIRELTLQFKPLSGRTDFLWEVGSGQNWVGYHIAGILALHEHFHTLTQNVVPRFLIVDQPSQVYFPEAWPSLDEPSEGQAKDGGSTDIEGVHRIFVALSRFMQLLKCEFQILVTEHAGEITWKDVPNIHVVGNWRQGHDEFLIPAAWIVEK
jgi:energy-coupling factor transporter ATP-binding protein EcfA2